MKKPVVFLLTLLILVALPGCHQQPDKEEQGNIILDVDTSVDDIMAILYLLTCPNINIKAITTVNGVSDADAGTEIVLRLLNLTGHGDIPVAKGASKPIEGDNSFPEIWAPAVDKPFGLPLPAHQLEPINIPADSLIYHLIKTHRSNISILAFGPVTNIALSFMKHPELHKHVTGIYMSDGAIYVKGAINLEYPEINNTVSGWNQWVDPKAADIVFNSGAPVKLIPLDLTALHSSDAIVLGKDLIKDFNEIACSEEGKALQTLMNNWINIYLSDIPKEEALDMVPVWDLVAALIYHYPEIATGWKDCDVKIALGTPETDGQILIRESDEPKVRIYLKGSQSGFDSLFLKAAACNNTISQ
jgi:purine nucleosidase